MTLLLIMDCLATTLIFQHVHVHCIYCEHKISQNFQRQERLQKETHMTIGHMT